MEVTRKNFKETLPLVAESIDKADFLVIDSEFTGLINGRDVSMFDSPDEYYTTILNGSAEFLLIQYGLCAFYWDEDKQHYMNDAYNFYLFPRSLRGQEKTFLSQCSSLEFLASQGFDFNKLIKEGISYMTERSETRLRESLAERQKQYSNQDTIFIPDENKPQIEQICTKVRQFLEDGASDEMEIDRCNAFIRRLLFQELGTRFKNEIFLEIKILENKSRVLKVNRVTSESDGKNRDMQKREKEWEDLEDAVGFSKVARMISQSQKLVIGHNMLLDLIHTLNHFFQPLPASYDSFKEFAHCMFPRILDTKYMSSLPPFKDKVNSSVLQHLLGTLSEPPFALPKVESLEGRGYSRADDKHHEAGYDAYVTGLCFLAMHAHLTSMRGEPSARVGASHSPVVKPFINKVFLAKTAYQDSPYMNLNGDDPTPSRDHVFHLTFPKEWQRNEISQLFSPFGPITVKFLEDTQALVALSRREQSRDVSRLLKGHPRVKVKPYSHYKNPNEAPRERRITLPPPQTTLETPKSSSLVTPSAGGIPEKVPSTLSPGSSEKVASTLSPGIPEKVARPRSNSASSPGPKPSRKRTSSGVFHVDEAEPPPKLVNVQKPEMTRKIESFKNGVRKTAETEKAKAKETREMGKEKKIIVERFDGGDGKTKCVSAFKESDSWD